MGEQGFHDVLDFVIPLLGFVPLVQLLAIIAYATLRRKIRDSWRLREEARRQREGVVADGDVVPRHTQSFREAAEDSCGDSCGSGLCLQRVDRDGSELCVWPEHWGITVKQCRELLAECQKDLHWDRNANMHRFVQKYVIPRTRGTGKGYALLANSQEPKEINVLVTHAWQENVEDFIATLERTVSESDGLFICAFALYQCEDGAGPTVKEQLGSRAMDSAIFRVLDHIRSRGSADGLLWRWRSTLAMFPWTCILYAVLIYSIQATVHACVPTSDGCAVLKGWRWERVHLPGSTFGGCFTAAVVSCACGLVAHVAFKARRIYNGRLVAVPNHHGSLFARLWCVYEIFVSSSMRIPSEAANTMAAYGKIGSMMATCTLPEDERRIRSEIRRDPRIGFHRVDNAIRVLSEQALRSAIWTLLTNGPIISLCGTAGIVCYLSAWVDGWDILGMVLGIWGGGAILCALGCFLSRSAGGVLTPANMRRSLLVFMGVCAVAAAGFVAIWLSNSARSLPVLFGFTIAFPLSCAHSTLVYIGIVLMMSQCPRLFKCRCCRLVAFFLPVGATIVVVACILASRGEDSDQYFPWMASAGLVSVMLFGRLQSPWWLCVRFGLGVGDKSPASVFCRGCSMEMGFSEVCSQTRLDLEAVDEECFDKEPLPRSPTRLNKVLVAL